MTEQEKIDIEFKSLIELNNKDLADKLNEILENGREVYFFKEGDLYKYTFKRYLDTEIIEQCGIKKVDKIDTVKWAAECVVDPSAIWF